MTYFLSVSASEYKVICDVSESEVRAAMSDNMTVTMCDLVPGQYGSVETCSVTVSWWDTDIWCAVRAVDTVGNVNQLSNMVTAHLPQLVTTPAPAPADTHHQLLEIIRHGNYSQIQELLSLTGIDGDGGRGQTNSIYIATGVMAGVVTVIVIMLLVMIYRYNTNDMMAHILLTLHIIVW